MHDHRIRVFQNRIFYTLQYKTHCVVITTTSLNQELTIKSDYLSNTIEKEIKSY